MDIKAIKEAGKEPVVLTIIANMDHVDHVVRMSDGEVEAGKDVFHVVTK